MYLINQKFGQQGQTTVEYILLIAVVVSVFSVMMKTPAIKDFFSPSGKSLNALKLELEYSYRHGFRGKADFKIPNYNSYNHESYYYKGETRFFSSKDAYP